MVPKGLGARKFQTKYTETGDRSVWTRMPGEEPKVDSDFKIFLSHCKVHASF